MIRIEKDQPYKPEYVGMIHYSAYWGAYSLILYVGPNVVTELDSFGDENRRDHHQIRTHSTWLHRGDRLLTVQEFHQAF